MPTVKKEWHGRALQARIDRASGRAIVGIAERVVVETKRVTHVDKGTLRRSVHAAPVGYDPIGDEALAQTTDLSMAMGEVEATKTPTGSAVEVGSWLSYACAEWIGRNHPGVTQGLEIVRPQCDKIVLLAFKQEGL